MSNLHSVLTQLCERDGITPYKMCKAVGIQPSIMTDLKMGRRRTVKAETATKIASYFGVSVEYLLGEEERPAIESDDKPKKIDEKDIQFALFGGGEVSEEAWEDVKDFVQFIRVKYKLDDKKGAGKGDSR